MTLTQPAAVRRVTSSLDARRATTAKALTIRAREARIRLNQGRSRGDFGHLRRVYD
jgi:hypothetical protein